MSRARILKTQIRQTNKDRPRRRYRLSRRGLKSLRATALRNKPWLGSTGPRTTAGKDRSKLNATKHGERSARSRAAWRELNAALRALDQYDRDAAGALDGVLNDKPRSAKRHVGNAHRRRAAPLGPVERTDTCTIQKYAVEW